MSPRFPPLSSSGHGAQITGRSRESLNCNASSLLGRSRGSVRSRAQPDMRAGNTFALPAKRDNTGPILFHLRERRRATSRRTPTLRLARAPRDTPQASDYKPNLRSDTTLGFRRLANPLRPPPDRIFAAHGALPTLFFGVFQGGRTDAKNLALVTRSTIVQRGFLSRVFSRVNVTSTLPKPAA